MCNTCAFECRRGNICPKIIFKNTKIKTALCIALGWDNLVLWISSSEILLYEATYVLDVSIRS